MRDRENILPTSLPPRGLSRVQAAAYIGVSPTLFDQMVDDGRMPQAIRINTRVLWDRLQLDEAFAGLVSKEESSAAMPDDYAKPPRA